MTVILPVVFFVLMFVALADIITIDGSRMKHLPKFLWIILVILLPLIGSILWFLVGREYPQPSMGSPRAPRFRASADSFSSPRDSGIPLGPRDTEAELAALNREIEAHERVERIRELEAQLEAKRREKGSAS
ncbi:MAG: PLDc N-terminal domain-containing protein [Terrimesophilobacter sp.]